MPKLVAFLRAINVGGRNVTMNELRAIVESSGFTNVETFIASGNVIFDSSGPPARAEEKIEARLRQALGYEVATFVRTVAEVAAVAAYKPFSEASVQSSKTFCVGFLTETLTAEQTKSLMDFTSDIDAFHVNGREIYWLCRLGQMDSKFTNATFERKCKLRATFRGLNTIVRLAAKYPAGK
jgi:uncharacterized protein (DUF1697 family)